MAVEKRIEREKRDKQTGVGGRTRVAAGQLQLLKLDGSTGRHKSIVKSPRGHESLRAGSVLALCSHYLGHILFSVRNYMGID